MENIKPITVQTPKKQLTSPLPKLEQFDLSDTQLDAQEISKLNTHIIKCEVKIKELKIAIAMLLELKSAFEKLDRDNESSIIEDVDVDAQIKLFKREIHFFESKIRKNNDKIQKIITKDVIQSERYEKEMPQLKLCKKESEQEIQKLEIAIASLKKTSETLKNINSLFETVITEEAIHRETQILEKNKQKYGLKLQAIDAKITDLEAHEKIIQKVSVVFMQTQTNQQFFSENNKSFAIKKIESELNFNLNGLKLN